VDRIFQFNRYSVSIVLIGVVMACWAWIVPMSLDMYGGMSGSAAWMMTDKWDAMHLLLLCAMWVVMMVGMMLPSAAFAILGLATVESPHVDSKYVPRTGFTFMAGYLSIWVGFFCFGLLPPVDFGFDEDPIADDGNSERATELDIASRSECLSIYAAKTCVLEILPMSNRDSFVFRL